MSATIATEKLATYLAPAATILPATTVKPAPVLAIPGRTFHVHEHFKNDYETMLRDFTNEAVRADTGSGGKGKKGGGGGSGKFNASGIKAHTPPHVIGGIRRVGEIDYDMLVRLIFQLCGVGQGMYGIEQHRSSSHEKSTTMSVEQTHENNKWILHPCQCNNESLLVFMPGVPEIKKLIRLLNKEIEYGGSSPRASTTTSAPYTAQMSEDEDVSDDEDEGNENDSKSNRQNKSYARNNTQGSSSASSNATSSLQRQLRNLNILGLHGGMSQEEQRKIFVTTSGTPIPTPPNASNRAATGQIVPHTPRLHIIISTNVAEASITIPNVTVVIDTCKVKQMEYNSDRNMTCLMTQFAAQDSLQQRKGRAGRVQIGRCFRLITNNTYQVYIHNLNMLQYGVL